jgi:hypothetical protein
MQATQLLQREVVLDRATLVTRFSSVRSPFTLPGFPSLQVANGQSLHGTAYYSWCHEMSNANEWFSNRLNVQKQKHCYQDLGSTTGGPLIARGTNFNKSRQRLSSFFSYEVLKNIDISDPMPSDNAIRLTGVVSPCSNPRKEIQSI